MSRSTNGATCSLVLAALVPADISSAESSQGPIAELELSGIPLGGTVEEILEMYGEPTKTSELKAALDDFPHFGLRYDGLRLVLSMHGRTLLSYYVSAYRYRLRSGVGVGSSRKEVDAALGRAIYTRSGDNRNVIYLAWGSHGLSVPVQLTISLDGEVVSESSSV